jgi:protein-tyrosine phosphatase
LQLRRPQYGAILTAIAQAPAGGAVVHCVSGKDRTGLVVALLLALLGVPDAVIAEDYALSGLNLQDRHLGGTDGVPADPDVSTRLTVDSLSPPEAILTALTFVRAQYGSIEDYLGGAGVAEADIELLEARLK